MSKEPLEPWYNNPDRNCVNDFRFTESARGSNAKDTTAELIYLCLTCPVLKECAKEAERMMPGHNMVQGGRQWA